MEKIKIQGQESGACNWNLGSGVYKLDSRAKLPVPGGGFWILDSGAGQGFPPSSGPLILDSELSALDRGSLILDSKQWILDLDIQFWILDSGPRHPVLDVGVPQFWILDLQF